MMEKQQARRLILYGVVAAAMVVFALGRRPMRGIDPAEVRYVVASHSLPYRVKLVDRPEDIARVIETVGGLRVSLFGASDELLAGGHAYYGFYGEQGLLREVSVTTPKAFTDGKPHQIKMHSEQPLYELYGQLDYPEYQSEEDALAALGG